MRIQSKNQGKYIILSMDHKKKKANFNKQTAEKSTIFVKWSRKSTNFVKRLQIIHKFPQNTVEKGKFRQQSVRRKNSSFFFADLVPCLFKLHLKLQQDNQTEKEVL